MNRKLIRRVSFYFTTGEAQTFPLDTEEDLRRTTDGWLLLLTHQNGKEAITIMAEKVCFVRQQEFYVDELTEAEKLAKKLETGPKFDFR